MFCSTKIIDSESVPSTISISVGVFFSKLSIFYQLFILLGFDRNCLFYLINALFLRFYRSRRDRLFFNWHLTYFRLNNNLLFLSLLRLNNWSLLVSYYMNWKDHNIILFLIFLPKLLEIMIISYLLITSHRVNLKFNTFMFISLNDHRYFYVSPGLNSSCVRLCIQSLSFVCFDLDIVKLTLKSKLASVLFDITNVLVCSLSLKFNYSHEISIILSNNLYDWN